MTGVVLGVSAGLAAVAVAGVLFPVRRPRPIPDAEDSAALEAIRELDEQLRAGALGSEEHAALRTEAERRAVAVLRARDDQALRLPRRPTTPEDRNRVRRVVPLVAGGIIAAVVGAVLATYLRDRSPDQPISGAEVATSTAIEVFEQRVRDHPDDLAARLDLADRYLAAGN